MGKQIHTHSALLFVLSLYAPHVLSVQSVGESPSISQDSVVLSWYMPGAMSGDAEAQYNLGYLYESGWGVDPSRGQAIHWYRQAANNQHTLSQLRLGMMLYAGIGANPDQEEGMRWLRAAANGGNQIALRITDRVIAELGSTGEDINVIRKAYRLLEEGETKVVEFFDSEVPVQLASSMVGNAGSHSSSAKPTPKSPINDGLVVETNQIRAPGNPSETAPGLNRAVIAAIAEPASADPWTDKKVLLGRQLSESDFEFHPQPVNSTQMPVDVGANVFTKPAINLNSQSNTNDAGVEFNLGVTLLKGQGVTRDEAQGMRWLRAAASRDHEIARKYINLIDQAESGTERAPVLQTLLQAARWWDIDSFYEIGRLYEQGQSVAKDSNIALQWYRLASSLGNKDATLALTNLDQPGGQSNFAPFISKVKADSNIVSASMFDAGMATSTQPNRMPVFKAMAIIGLLSALAVWLIRALGRAISAKRHEQPEYSAGLKASFSHASSGPLVVEANDMEFMRNLWSAPQGVVVDAQDAESAPAKSKDRKPAPTAERSSPDMGESLVRQPTEKPAVVESASVVAIESQPVKAIQDTPAVVQPIAPTTEVATSVPLASTKLPPTSSPLLAGEQSVVINGKAGASVSESTIPTVTARVAGPAPTVDKPKPYSKPKAKSSSIVINGDPDALAFDKMDVRSKLQATAQPKVRYEYRSPAIVDATQGVTQAKVSATHSESAYKIPDQNAQGEDSTTLGRVQYNIAMMFARGDGVVRNEVLAAKWFEKSARLGNAESQFRMWALCSTGRSGVSMDPRQAQKWLRQAAASGHLPAIEVLQRQQRLTDGNAIVG